MNIHKYVYKPIDDARDDLIGARIFDIESNGAAIFLADSKGRKFIIDTTGSEKVVHALANDNEKIEQLTTIVECLLDKLGMSEDELLQMLEK